MLSCSEGENVRQKPSTADIQQVPTANPDISAPTKALARSAVCRRLPMNLRTRVDEAILLRPKELPTLEAIAAHFDLAQYRISLPALRAYARRLEELARPAAASQLIAGVLGCLPVGYRRRTLAGAQVLLLSRVVQALSCETNPPLSVAELARLGSVLALMARPHQASRSAGAKRTHFRPPPAAQGEMQLSRIQDVVRRVYGLSLPVASQESGRGEDSIAKPDTKTGT